MARPRRRDWTKLKRAARYLRGKPRVVHKYPFQKMGMINVCVDSNYAGCTATRKSTSGGAVYLGDHLIKSRASTHVVVATSSGEAEYYAIVKGSSAGLGLQSMMVDIGYAVKLGIHMDSSAAKAMASRIGLGKV